MMTSYNIIIREKIHHFIAIQEEALSLKFEVNNEVRRGTDRRTKDWRLR